MGWGMIAQCNSLQPPQPPISRKGMDWAVDEAKTFILQSNSIGCVTCGEDDAILQTKIGTSELKKTKQNWTKCQFIYVQWFSYTILSLWVFCTSEAGIAWNCFIYKTNLAHHLSLRKLAPCDNNFMTADR